MKSCLIKCALLITMFILHISNAVSSSLFNVTQKDAISPIQIKSSVSNQYLNAAIKVNTPGLSISRGCKSIDNGYCLFEANNLTPTLISLKSATPSYKPIQASITLCLNGQDSLSCQNYDVLYADKFDFSIYYAGTSCGVYHFIDISNTGIFLGSGNGLSFLVNLATDHSINLYGTNYSTIQMNTNGYISSSSDINIFNNTALPTTIINIPGDSLFVYWDDLDSIGLSPLGLYYQYFDICPRDTVDFLGQGCHVFQWITHYYGSTAPAFSFEALVYDITGEVSYQYDPGNAQYGSGATTGSQNTSRTSYVQLSYNAADSVLPNSVRCLKHYQDNI